MVAFGRTLVWGQIPTYVYWPPGYNAPLNPAAFSFLQKIVNARVTFARKYVVTGLMLPPPVVQSPTFTATYFIGGSGNLSSSKDFPAVQLAAWKAPDGDVGIVFANTDKKSVQIQLPVNFKRLSLDGKQIYTACLLRASGGVELSPAVGPEATYDVQLDPSDVGVLELSAVPRACPSSVPG